MYIYALGYRNPYQGDKPFVLFLAAQRLLRRDEALAAAVETVRNDSFGNEWVDAVSQGALCGPLEVDGNLPQPTIAVVVD
ncbi:MAG: hypothetical protein IT204_20865 [Fimbriimonadaceae bacterium]|nr:hypothetical protein [Fimbriimonadaceae bacterium]